MNITDTDASTTNHAEGDFIVTLILFIGFIGFFVFLTLKTCCPLPYSYTSNPIEQKPNMNMTINKSSSSSIRISDHQLSLFLSEKESTSIATSTATSTSTKTKISLKKNLPTSENSISSYDSTSIKERINSI